jgi:hypothetical protein
LVITTIFITSFDAISICQKHDYKSSAKNY